MDHKSRSAARVAHILREETSNSGHAGTAVEENYGNKAAGPSSSARFKRGGVARLAAIRAEDEPKPKPRMDRMPRKSGGVCKVPKRYDGGAVGGMDGGPSGMDVGETNHVLATKQAEEDALLKKVQGMIDAKPPGSEEVAPDGGPVNPTNEVVAGAAAPFIDAPIPLGHKRGGKVGKPKRAFGGSVLADEMVLDGAQDTPASVSDPDAPSSRAAASAEKRRGNTTVNVVIAPQGGGGAVPPVAPPIPAPITGGPPVPSPKPPPMIPPAAAMAGMPMRKRGGSVTAPKMEAGAGSGLGRLEKAKKYGA